MGFKIDDKMLCGPLTPPRDDWPVWRVAVAAVDPASGELTLVPARDSTRPTGDWRSAFTPGERLLLSSPDDYVLAEAVSADDSGWRVSELFDEAAQTFRVEDSLQVVVRKVEREAVTQVSRLLTGAPLDADAERFMVEDTSIGMIATMFSELNRKLNSVVNLIYLGGEGLMQAERRKATLSVNNLVLRLDDPVQILDLVEVKLLLPMAHPTGALIYGAVARVRPLPGGGREAAIHFMELDDEVRNLVIQYQLGVQRKIIRKRRGFD